MLSPTFSLTFRQSDHSFSRSFQDSKILWNSIALRLLPYNEFHRVRRSSELHSDAFDRWDLYQTVAKHTIYVVVLQIADSNLHDIKKKKTISFSNFPGTFATFKAVISLNVAKYFAARSSWWEKFNIYFADTKRHKDLICGNSALMGSDFIGGEVVNIFFWRRKRNLLFFSFLFRHSRSGIE